MKKNFPRACCCCLDPFIVSTMKVRGGYRQSNVIYNLETEVPICGSCSNKRKNKIRELIFSLVLLVIVVMPPAFFISSSDQPDSERIIFVFILGIVFILGCGLVLWRVVRTVKLGYWFPAEYEWRKIRKGTGLDTIFELTFKNKKYQEMYDRLNEIVAGES